MPGLLIAAPASGSGKTTVTLGLLRAFRRRGFAIASAKAGPDYIDPAFHAAAGSRPCVNLDPWAMRPELLHALAAEAIAGGASLAGRASAAGGSSAVATAGHCRSTSTVTSPAAFDVGSTVSGDGETAATEGLVVEAMMGLFDGAADGSGSSADLAALLGLGVVLVVDCARQSHSVAALVRGFRDHRPGVRLAGLILNRTGSPRHAAMLATALAPLGLPILGILPSEAALRLPERHLGLVQAGEHGDLEGFLDQAADAVERHLDLPALRRLAAWPDAENDRPDRREGVRASRADGAVPRLPPLGQRIAVARDTAFAFAYPHLLAGWRTAGAEISFFSPLADEAPDPAADAIYLPGGYPELHAGVLAAASHFRAGLKAAAVRGATVYGECGGYMVLGEGLVDAGGTAHAMLGLLPLSTSFADRQRHLGYRRAEMQFPWKGAVTAHEFHYARILSEGAAKPLLSATDAAGTDLGPMGLNVGSVGGSFLHVVDRT